MYGKPADSQQFTIASGQPYSGWLNIAGRRALAVGFPASMDGTGFTIEAAEDEEGTGAKVVNGLSVTKQNSEIVALTSDALHRGLQALHWIRFKSSTNETSTRTYTLFRGGW